MVSRRDGYREGMPKEEAALHVLETFYSHKFGVSLQRISDADENYRLGDFRLPSGRTIECKGQPIDPVRYPSNFVEVFEVTNNARHAGGLARVAALLDIPLVDLERAAVRDIPRSRRQPLGHPPRVSVSLTSIAGSHFTAYVNPDDGGRHIYIYRRDELLKHVQTAVMRELLRGAGKSNEDTLAVLIPLSLWRWARTKDQGWQYQGIASEPRPRL
jgi:hypothetical protein